MRKWVFVLALALIQAAPAGAAAPKTPSTAAPPVAQGAEGPSANLPGDRMLSEYFAQQTAMLAETPIARIQSLDEWNERRPLLKRQLFEMLGLDPLPERTDLAATVTGRTERDDIVVENLHFQSRPGLYVTANLYRPKSQQGRLPAVLYVCGHGRVAIDGVSYGNKVAYQHHGRWFARHGYVCLTIDTLQLGEIEGIHHGTYREGMWWWNNRGYTPAGVEAWNCIRALDYLQSRAEVDPERLGVTGRSGGGAYSWWIASIDDRIKAAVPVAGITDLQNHVVDGKVEGHCDCMFMVNTYRWDYPTVAAMVAPRPLLLTNSDRDSIFPLDGVVRTYFAARRIYELFDKGTDLGLVIGPGPHKDTQDLQVPAFRWFNQHLRGDVTTLIDEPAEKRFEPQELKVFDRLPADQLNTKIHESFVAAAPQPPVPSTAGQWRQMADKMRQTLLEKSFRAWPRDNLTLELHQLGKEQSTDEWQLRRYDFRSEGPWRLPFYVLRPRGGRPRQVEVLVAGSTDEWRDMVGAAESLLSQNDGASGGKASVLARRMAEDLRQRHAALVLTAVRGVGPTAWTIESEKEATQILRRFMLLGATLDSTRVWDIRRAVQMAAWVDSGTLKDLPVAVCASGVTAGEALYAALYEPSVERLELTGLPPTHRNGPIFLNVSRVLEMPTAVALAAEKCQVVLRGGRAGDWKYPQAVASRLGWPERLEMAQ